MSDEHLRKLERKWKETGSPEDEIAYLRERIRLGQIPTRSVSLTLCSPPDRESYLCVEPFAEQFTIPAGGEIELVVKSSSDREPWVTFQETEDGGFTAHTTDDYEVLWKGKPLAPFTEPDTA